MERVYRQLLEEKVGKVRRNEPLAKHTTIKIGGPAPLFIEPADLSGLVTAVNILRAARVPWRAIGRGSNLLVDDAGVDGAVIKIGKGLSYLSFEDDRLRIGAGYPLVPLATTLSRKGYAGFEFTGGIPGSVGGAVYMNAGAHGSETKDLLLEARILFPDGTLKWLTKEELGFGYRTSALQKRQGICVEAVFKLEKGDAEAIWNDLQAYKEYRHRTQPYDEKCAGSIFRNPLPDHAGKLIEDLGLKGYAVGGAKISERHGNFIVNAGGATAQDVLDLIRFVQEKIKTRYGIDLQTEVEILRKSGDA